MNSPKDINLIPTDDLVTELLNRFDNSVFMGVRFTGKDTVSIRRWHGNSYTCAGLTNSINRSVLNDFDSKEEPIGKDEL